MGRKAKVINWQQFEQLCREVKTLKATAVRLDVSVDVLRLRIRDRYNDVYTYVQRDLRNGRTRQVKENMK